MNRERKLRSQADGYQLQGAAGGILIGLLASCLGGCAGGIAGGAAAGAAGATVLGGEAPSQELEQIYYLGVFDPHEQVPEAVYRITVRGQASALSGVRFASGWVPARFVDSLTTTIGSAGTPTTNPAIDKGDPQYLASLGTGRRMILFGPEGFRVSPADQRLVIVMGASPEAFFNAIDLSLGALAGASSKKVDSAVAPEVYRALADARAHSQLLSELEREVDHELADSAQ